MCKLCVFNTDTEGPTLAVGTQQQMEQLRATLAELLVGFAPSDEDERPEFVIVEVD